MKDFLLFITSPKFKSVVAIVAAVVMYYTPDEVDHIIEALLGALGISTLVIETKKY